MDLELRTIRRVTMRLVPFLVVCYFVAYLDRVNVGFAKLTMSKDLGLSETAFGLGAGIFFLAYFIFEVPSNLLLEKVGARKWIARIMLTWGILSGSMAFITGEYSFYTVRVLLGFAEAEARPAWQSHCAACHGAGLRGDPGLGVPDLTRRDRLYGSDRVADIERTILYGIRSGHPKGWNRADMPGFAKPTPYRRYAIASLSPAEISDLVTFLRAGNGQPGDPGAAGRGRVLFGGKGQCFDCHAVDARGDNAIGAPNLLRGVWLYGHGTAADLTDSISDGRSGACPAWIAVLPPVTIRALAVFVHDAVRNAS